EVLAVRLGTDVDVLAVRTDGERADRPEQGSVVAAVDAAAADAALRPAELLEGAARAPREDCEGAVVALLLVGVRADAVGAHVDGLAVRAHGDRADGACDEPASLAATGRGAEATLGAAELCQGAGLRVPRQNREVERDDIDGLAVRADRERRRALDPARLRALAAAAAFRHAACGTGQLRELAGAVAGEDGDAAARSRGGDVHVLA